MKLYHANQSNLIPKHLVILNGSEAAVRDLTNANRAIAVAGPLKAAFAALGSFRPHNRQTPT